MSGCVCGLHLPHSIGKSSPVLVAYDDDIESTMALVLPPKGGGGGLMIVACRSGQWIHGLGHGKIILKSEQEPAIVDFASITREEIINAMEDIARNARSVRGMEAEWQSPSLVIEHPPVGESKSKGAVENAIKRVQGKIFIVKLELEEFIGRKIPANSNIWQWLVECSADTCIFFT